MDGYSHGHSDGSVQRGAGVGMEVNQPPAGDDDGTGGAVGGGALEGLFRDEMVWKLLAMIGRVGIGPFKLVRYRIEESDGKVMASPSHSPTNP